MAKKRYRAEQIFGLLRPAEVELAQRHKTTDVCRKLGITGQIYNRWRKQYGNLKRDQVRRLRELQKENRLLKQWWPTRLWTSPF